MPTYSFGEDSPLKFEIPDKLASRYNEAVEQFLKAQRRFMQKFGRPWDPATDPINLKWTRKQQKAWNEFAKIFQKKVLQEGPFAPSDIMDDFLVLNVSVAAATSEKWKVIAGASAYAGALYVVLRGL